jgi:Ca-activated chloride channel family protein
MRTHLFKQTFIPVFLLASAMPPFALADGGTPTPQKLETATTQETIRLGDAQDGSLLFKTQTPGRYVKAPTVATDVKMKVAGPIIRTTLSQTFKNPSVEFVEGVYVFPLPDKAAVDRLRIVVGGRFIEGQIKEKKQAKQIYETAKREGKKASLVEQERPNVFTASVANIGPNETVSIQIEYQDSADIKNGVASLIFPMTVAPRYSPPAETIQLVSANGTMPVTLDPVLDRHRITPPLMPPAEEPIEYLRLPVSINIELDAGFDIEKIESPYHSIKVDQSDEDSAMITLADGEVPANRDFKLSWQATPKVEAQQTLFKETIGDNTYLMSFVAPPKATGFEVLNRHKRQSHFVIDTSGSMGGTSIVQARRALKLGLSQLGPDDEFNVIEFNSDHTALYSSPRKATRENIEDALKWVSNLDAGGGTNMFPALKDALKGDAPEGLLKQIIFITDGSIGNEQQLFALIQDELKSARLFPVGIGSAPNRFFMSRAAKFGRGTSVVIGDINEVDKEMGSLFESLSHPVLTNLQLSFQNGAESYPSNIPDLYSGEPVVTVTKLASSELPDTLTFRGHYPDKIWQEQISLNDAIEAKGLSVLWARRKIADLEENRFSRDNAAQIDAEILKTALDYHLVSRLTSLVAVDVTPTRSPNDPLITQKVPTQLPEGWDFAALQALKPASPSARQNATSTSRVRAQESIALPSTASPHVFLILLGSLLMLLSRLFKGQTCRDA